MAQIELDASELKTFVRHIIENNRTLQKEGNKPTSLEIIGEAGLGKTSIVKQIADEMGLTFVKLSLAQIEELGD